MQSASEVCCEKWREIGDRGRASNKQPGNRSSDLLWAKNWKQKYIDNGHRRIGAIDVGSTLISINSEGEDSHKLHKCRQ